MIYLRISLLGAPAMLAVLAGTGVLRGLQDTRTPLVVAVAANVVNVVAERHVRARPALGHRRLGVGHADRADRRRRRPTWPSSAAAPGGPGSRFAPDLAGLRAAALAGASLVIRTIALQAVLIITTAIAARQGNAAIAAHQVAFRIWGLLAFALDAIAIAGPGHHRHATWARATWPGRGPPPAG